LYRLLKSFRYGELDLIYGQTDHLIGLAEILLLDTYRADLLKNGDTVIDLGAGIGDFTVLASKKVGQNGKVIAFEPNTEDFKLLQINAEKNSCKNVIALNLGVADRPGEKEISFWGRKYTFRSDTLENVLARLNISRIHFVKMDIEGFETAVIRKSIEIVKQADVISIELHGTKDEVDGLLRSHGFAFRPVPWWRGWARFIQNLVRHTSASSQALLFTVSAYPKIMAGEVLGRDRFTTGTYIRPAEHAMIIQ
jgi:FkbM family methyltransferase